MKNTQPENLLYLDKVTFMIIERTNSEIIFRLPGDIKIDELQELTDWFRYLEVTRKSKATQADVDILVRSVKKGRWARRKQLLSK
jgi:hypothetical protein